MAPYAPKGTISHPGHIPFIAHKVAELKKTDIDKVLVAVRENSRQMYGF